MNERTAMLLQRFKAMGWNANKAEKEAKIAFSSYKSVLTEIQESPDFQEEIQRDMARLLEEQWARILEKGNALADALGDKHHDFVERVFQSAFKNIKYKVTEILPAKDGRRWKVVVGPYGFGKRYNIQSVPIDDYDYILELVDERKAVCDALDAIGLAKWSAKFGAFCDAFPKNMQDERFVIPLSKPIIIQRWGNEAPFSCESIGFEPGGSSLQFFDGKNEIDRVDLLEPDRQGAAHIAQIIDALPGLLTNLERMIESAAEEVAKSRLKLENDFGRELLMAEV